jgi:hypothetical protein
MSCVLDIYKKLADDYSFGVCHFGITAGFIKAGTNDEFPYKQLIKSHKELYRSVLSCGTCCVFNEIGRIRRA